MFGIADLICWPQGSPPVVGDDLTWTRLILVLRVATSLIVAICFSAFAWVLYRSGREHPRPRVASLVRWSSAFFLICALTFAHFALTCVYPHPPSGALVRLVLLLVTAFVMVRVPELVRALQHRSSAVAQRRSDESNFEAVFHASSVGIVIRSLDGSIERANEAFCRFLRRPPADLHGNHYAAYLPDPFRSRDGDLFDELVRGSIPSYAMEKGFELPGGGQRS